MVILFPVEYSYHSRMTHPKLPGALKFMPSVRVLASYLVVESITKGNLK